VKKGEQSPKVPTNPAAVSLDFFKEVSNAKIKQLYEHYRMDFKIFGYTADQYYNT
jgi:hypothetical protein